MSIAKTVRQYLDNKHIVYSVLELAEFESPLQAARLGNIPPEALYYPVVLRDNFGLLMAVLPATHTLDYERLGAILRRRAEPAFQTQLEAVFADCHPGHIPPLGEPYGVRTLIDANLAVPSQVYVLAGDRNRLLCLARKDFLLLQSNAWLASDFTRPVVLEETPEGGTATQNLRQRIEQITILPPVSDLAAQLLKLYNNPTSEVNDLVAVIERDPSLAAQVMRYASAPFFGYAGKVDSLGIAIARVLGYDMVMHLALGIAVTRPFRLPRHGKLGMEAMWRHAIYSARLATALAREMPTNRRPRNGSVYLGGLLHNFGYFLLGHLFRDEYLDLVDACNNQPARPVHELERERFGITHAELGAWLLKAWHLPDEVVTAIREHHNPGYNASHAEHVRLMLVTDRLLASQGMGDDPATEVAAEIYAALGLDEVRAMLVLNKVMEGAAQLNDFARQLAA